MKTLFNFALFVFNFGRADIGRPGPGTAYIDPPRRGEARAGSVEGVPDPGSPISALPRPACGRVDIGVLGPGIAYINPPTPGHGPIVCHNAYAYLKHMIVYI